MKLLLAILLLVISVNSNAQTQTSPNLIGSHNLTGTTSTTSTGGGYSGGSTPGYNSTTNTIMFGYTQSTIAYTYALSQALQNSGLVFTGYNYSWEYLNQDYSRGSLSATINFIGINGANLHSKSWTLGTTTDWTTVSGTETFTNSILTSVLANFSLSFTGKDDRYWAGFYGPQVRNPSLSINYTYDQCSTNPLSSPTCPGYSAAYLTQQCSINSLYDPSCPNYATAYLTQQCTINSLYSPSCPGYAAAYLTYQCNIDALYSTTCPGYAAAYKTQQCNANQLYATDCPGYAAAYAKKNILNIGSSTTTTPTTTTSTTAVITSTSDPVAQVAPLVSDPTVNSVITSKGTTANAEANPAAAVKITQTAPATTTTPQDSGAKKSDTKSDSTTSTADNKKSSDKPQTAREKLAEQRREAAKKEAVTKGKELANNMGKLADMQAQMEVQNVVIQAMGYTPGFDTYSRLLPDTQFYKPYEVYAGQRNVDSVAGRRLFGGTDAIHQQMVDAQYNLGN